MSQLPNKGALCPLEPPLLSERLKRTIRNDWGEFCSIVPTIVPKVPGLVLVTWLKLWSKASEEFYLKPFFFIFVIKVVDSTISTSSETLKNELQRYFLSFSVHLHKVIPYHSDIFIASSFCLRKSSLSFVTCILYFNTQVNFSTFIKN